ncbi:MAG: pilus assembly protein PilP [Oceanococcus sp.]
MKPTSSSTFKTVSRVGAVCLGVVALSSCARDMSDLQSYIADVKARKSSAIDPIPQMQPYEPYAYSRAEDRSPFEPIAKDEPSTVEAAMVPPNSLRPDLSRNREPLEEFPLDGIRLLGTLEIRQQIFALLSAPDGIVHRATYGDHMGQNFGKIVSISDAQIQLEEIVPDGFGGYVKRMALVALSEEN